MVERMVRRPKAALAILGGVAAASALLVPFLGEGFLPEFHETDLLMHWVGKPGTSLEEMRRTTELASRELRKIPGVRNFGSHIGRAEVADEVVGSNFTELWISLDPDADYEAVTTRVRTTVAAYPGIQRDVQTYLQERMKEVLTGASGSIVVRLFGPSLEALRDGAKAVATSLEAVPGVTNLKVEPQVLVPQAEVRVDPGASRLYGLSQGEIRRTVSTIVQGTRVGEVYRGDGALNVVVWGTDETKTDVTSLRKIGLVAPSGAMVRLEDVARVRVAPMPNAISREDAARKIDVTCDAKGRDLGAVAREVSEKVLSIPLPAGHHAEVLGQYAARSAARSRIVWLSALSVLGIAILLYGDFGTARTAGMVLGTLPFALVGGVATVVVSGGVVSLGSLVGFVTVLGIAARNGILLISHYRHLEHEEGVAFGPDLVVRGAVERVIPILMTALATALALVPLVIAGPNRPGNEIEHPMALVILGGLVTSTVLNLFLVPPLYLGFSGLARRRVSGAR
jgi:Cu/Ag efflux pump CusA